ncbi:hypothetical protein SASPL_107089 [Salvia splendens]|uniref:Uncharacterized protein n=1 Tax=Salvia splendens TaxID=180675 RepID=A0A8X8YFF4_SALSN|nr:uncharacterized protein LOC121793666 [Salvia splendens]KAG6429050.1 hypothetical protein SASPL_107089 [Salvia splendens]
MNITRSISSFGPVRPPSLVSQPCLNSLPLFSFSLIPNMHVCPSHLVKFPPTSPNPTCTRRFPIIAANQEAVSEVEFEEFLDKDWSFLEFDDTDTDGEHMQKIDRIISAGNIKETSKVLVSVGSEAFVDRIVCSSPCEQLFVAHDSLLILACIKERYDKVKCWQGELIDVPEKWTAFDVVYLYFLPALSSELDQVLAALAKRCLPGARVVISHPHGREAVEEQKQQYPDVVVSNLPEKMTLQTTMANHSFQLLEFVDEPGFYLAVMRFD